MCIEVIDVDTMFSYTLDVYFKSALFVDDGGHIVDKVLRSYPIDIVKHHPTGLRWFAVGDCVSLPMMICFVRVWWILLLWTFEVRDICCYGCVSS